MRTLYRCAFTDPPILPFLKAYYTKGSRFEELLAGGEYHVVECVACTLIFQQDVGSPGFLERVYDDWLGGTHNPDEDPDHRHLLEHPLQSRDGHEVLAVARFLHKPLSAMSVLDFGMGWAGWARIARTLGSKVYGLDLSKQRCAFAVERGIEVVSWEQIAGLKLDFVNAEQVLEHVSQPFVDLKQIADSLQGGGVVKVAVPQSRHVEELLRSPDFFAPRSTRRSLNAVHPIEHVNCFNRRALSAMAERAGVAAQAG